ncbi:uncharacterized protein Nmag_3234 [Natrialba magadii ATCC 43099]|uniref:Uncharacterized protein n=1 Tax=Natrialba magadii (strain ATCC 43099 / DSM 3394 / CCM 3739 / CIP 104546 / IAM 13178 / JCM 8861 / NBRC 102185 / NCIMB 2190 / MS3) TaxID=547559 RepID=D3SS10_NATMM|nr:hypothetical protein [Natrialba magadii]ADD06784.1 uncharacterized protein Nmag_3234 [Natrialba magadii ATCC 43099]ELY27780.1 hypothetical protein C500_14066 [Natrialba magadii ATCC 43099]
MHRRRVLAHVGTGTVIGTVGCLSVPLPTGDSGQSSDSPESRDGADSQIPDIRTQPCPPSETDRESAVCSHTVDPDSATVSLESRPKRSTVADGVPETEISLTLRNDSASELTFNPYSWHIRTNTGAGWHDIQQDRAGNGTLTVPAGEVQTWSLVDAVTAVRDDPELEPGLYAAELTVPAPTQEDDSIACIALVRLDAAS